MPPCHREKSLWAPHGGAGALCLGVYMSEEVATNFGVIRDALREYAEFAAWQVTASADQLHAVEIVESVLGRTVLNQAAENLLAAVSDPFGP